MSTSLSSVRRLFFKVTNSSPPVHQFGDARYKWPAELQPQCVPFFVLVGNTAAESLLTPRIYVSSDLVDLDYTTAFCPLATSDLVTRRPNYSRHPT